jgi:hypothetical protein
MNQGLPHSKVGVLKALTLLLSAGIAAGAFAVFGPEQAEQPKRIVPSTALEYPSTVYRIETAESADSCRIEKGAVVAEGKSFLHVDDDCKSIYPGISDAKFWVEDEDGAVSFTENGVDPIVTFSVADGAAYESFKPHAPMLSLMVE